MGATAADTKREIEEIRKDVSSAVSELKGRVIRAVSPRTYLELAQENPAAVIGVGLAGLSLAGVVLARSIAEQRRQNRPTARLQRAAMGAVEELSETAQRAWAAAPSLPVEVRLGTRDAKGSNQETTLAKGSDSSMLKRALWAGLVAAMMAGGGLVARRLSAQIWRTTMGEAPPTKDL
ncbi:MAG: hypothetical protein U0893_25345 [Chloroflexota bacterium]